VASRAAVIDYLESVAYNRRRDPAATIVRWILVGLSLIYRGVLALYLLPFRLGLRRQAHLGCPTISVGNISVGGTGKTPTVQYLCKGLAQAGWKPAVLSYGYRSSLSGRFGVVSNGQEILLMPETAGDEPVMLAKRLPGIPVLVGKDRASSGRTAIENLGANVLVLDDGFQVWKLHRDVEIALVRTTDPFDNGFVLPAGRLREPPSALRRADCIVAIGGVCENSHRADLIRLLTDVAGEKPIVFARYEATNFYSLNDGTTIALRSLYGVKALALSGIANPSSFEETLKELGVEIVERKHFPDHHTYSQDDIERLKEMFTKSGADWVITTEKDAIKLENHEMTIPALALRIELRLENESTFWKLISEKIGDPPQISDMV